MASRAFRNYKFLLLHAAAGMLLVSSCALQEITPPNPQAPESWLQQSGNTDTSQIIPRQWWAYFNDPALDRLIEKAVQANPDKRLAIARIDEARALARNASARLLPLIQGVASAERRGVPNNGNNFRSGIVEQYTAGFDASWELDLFGRNRETARAARADAEAFSADSDAVTLSLSAETARQYTLYRLYQAQADLAASNSAAQQGVLRVSEARYRQGIESNLELMRSRALLQTTQARIPLYRDLAQTAAYQIDYLTGEKPGGNNALLEQKTDIPLIDRQIFLEVPLDVIRRRPDVIATERRVLAQTSLSRAAIAAIYPTISVSGLLGLSSVSAGDLLGSDSKNWSLGGNVLAPLLDFGRIRSNIDASKARQQQAVILYEQTVLAALRDVETAASSYAKSRERYATLSQAMASSGQAVDIARKQYAAGILSQLDVLQAEQTSYTAQEATAQAAAELTQNYILVCKALAIYPH